MKTQIAEGHLKSKFYRIIYKLLFFSVSTVDSAKICCIHITPFIAFGIVLPKFISIKKSKS